ncbi:hypothetical protein [Prosthecobacter sp.]|jgi:hypothetical protein|uniref:hypothetical protein n=1 Tax=Prosthecobacter sp. TaxID=1965333 RepID=UPI0037C9BD8C
MTPVRKIIGFTLLTALLASVALWITRESLRPQEPPREMGLSWLKEEYYLDDAAFESVSALHKDYFKRCDKMCRQINEADRPLLGRIRQRGRTTGERDAQLSREQAICADCEKAAAEHLRQVAELMSQEEGKRFLNDFLPILNEQRREHDRRLSSSLRR